MMEVELEPGVKPLGYKVKAASRESLPSQKAAQILELDLRSHWSTGTNTKEWILLELDEPCLLSHIRIYNKSVLEWEIAVGLRFKPETFTRVRPRCEAPRREMMYQMNYMPCRYVRISCLRGNPIAIFFIQLIGVPVIGLEPEFQPVVSHLLPQIVAHKHDVHNMHLQLLQDMLKKLVVFLPQLEVDLAGLTDDAEANLRFLAMLAGPLYPILHIVNERETTRSLSIMSDSEVSKSQQPSAFTVSSNFERRRSRSTSPFLAVSSSTAFRPDAVFMLLRKAYRDTDLGTVCRTVSRMLRHLIEPVVGQQTSFDTTGETFTKDDETVKPGSVNPFSLVDYSSLFGEEFHMPNDEWDTSYFNILDVRAVEEGILHVLYACASQPMLCHKLAGSCSEFWSALPLVQALLPALRPSGSNLDPLDESFSVWRQPYIQQALSQIVMTTSSSVYRPLLHAAAGYLSSFSQSHVKAACVLIDLCSSVLAPWMPHVVAKVDLAVELLEDLLGTIQSAPYSLSRAQAALKYILLALSGHMDDLLGKYKEVKLRILFLIEMLEPFLDPAITKFKSSIAFGDVGSKFPEKMEHNCEIAVNVIRTAIRKSAVLPSLEYEWRSGSVAPRVLLSVLEPHMQLPPELDLCKSPASEMIQHAPSSASDFPFSARYVGVSAKSSGEEELDGKMDMSDSAIKMEITEDANSFFAPPEVRNISLTVMSSIQENSSPDAKLVDASAEQDLGAVKSFTDQFQSNLVLDEGFGAEYINLQADYFQLANCGECELRAAEFRHLASDLHTQHEISVETHDAAVDALLLAAECYINPFFMMSSRPSWKVLSDRDMSRVKNDKSNVVIVSKKFLNNSSNLESINHLENKRDKVVLQLLLEAAEWDRNYWQMMSGDELRSCYSELSDGGVIKLSPGDLQSTDAVTLVRQNQTLLCKFLIRQLQREQHSMHEVLLQSLLFLLESATTLSCDAGNVIDIILSSAEYLNGLVVSYYRCSKERNPQLNLKKLHHAQRHWILLQKLIIASSGRDQHSELKFSHSSGFRSSILVPFSAWVHRIPTFSRSASPLVRFLGWMAVSRNARQYIRDRVLLASELSQLTCLLSIFADDLSTVDNFVHQKEDDRNAGDFHLSQPSTSTKGHEGDEQSGYQSFVVIYPDLCKFFPDMKRQFESFGETILEAISLQLRSLPSTALPEILCWFSESCLSPFCRKQSKDSRISTDGLKGRAGKNAKAIILYVLEAIVVEHMEAMVHEIPRLVHVLVSLCKSAYCDVLFLSSILSLLNPIISYSIQKFSDEVLLADDSCLNFESLCFNELFSEITEEGGSSKQFRRPLIIYVLSSLLPNLSLQPRRDTLRSLLLWADFSVSEPTTSFHDYLCAFQCMVDNCKLLLFQTLGKFGAVPLQLSEHIDSGTTLSYDDSSKSDTWFLNDILSRQLPTETAEKSDANAVILGKKINSLSVEEIREFTEHLEGLIEKLFVTIEHCWTLHHQLTKKLVISAAECFIYSRCLSTLIENSHRGEGESREYPKSFESVDQLLVDWGVGLHGLGQVLLVILQSCCWVVASLMIDCLLAVPTRIPVNVVIGTMCSAIMSFSCSAPKISWRLNTDKWLSIFFARGFYSFHEIEVPIVELFSVMLTHHEPEQRLIALKHLSKLVGQDVGEDTVVVFSSTCNKLISPTTVRAIPESILSVLVSSTWDFVTLMAASDTSFTLRTRAMALLIDYIPFANQGQLQSFLACSDTVLHGLGEFPNPSFDGPLFQLSLALIAGACLYSLPEDICLIPEKMWMNIESLGSSKTESRIGDLERRTCQVLCRLRNNGDEEKEALRDALSSRTIEQSDPDFGSIRETILQILANLTSAKSYVDAFPAETEHLTDQEVEMELEVIQNEHASKQPVKSSKESHRIRSPSAPPKDESRITQIKDRIVSIEKSRLKEEIIARRQKKLVMRRTRQKFLEEAALREAELLQELDRERVAEVEKDIERQRLLEIERARTRELRLNLDLEKERQAQRELQREMEQIESGRSSRREIPSSSQTSRSRDRYRERDSARSSTEASGRAMEATALSRSYSGQPPVILQSRERSDEYGSGYDENLDGSKDSGDTNSVGDAESMSAFEGQSAQRQSGSRGSSKSRQARERERESRREGGKWERKHP